MLSKTAWAATMSGTLCPASWQPVLVRRSSRTPIRFSDLCRRPDMAAIGPLLLRNSYKRLRSVFLKSSTRGASSQQGQMEGLAKPSGMRTPLSMHSVRETAVDAGVALPRAAYVHIPFCRRRCHYCDFPIQVVGKHSSSGRVVAGMEEYVEALCEEISTSLKTLSFAQSRPLLDSVFFGGGTPSLLPSFLLTRILECLDRSFGIAPAAEVSMEMDPGTFDALKLREFSTAGVNRISLGVQAFQAELLKACGRAHTLDDVQKALEAVHSVGVRNWSLDLISSLPNQTAQHWQDSLNQAVAAGPSHISVYDLQIEEGTAFGRWFTPGQGPLPSDDSSADMYRQASATLRAAGYHHYEISNYARPGSASRHNLVYWHGVPFLGFGLGAASYLGGQRFSRPKKMQEYYAWVKKYTAEGGRIEWPVDTAEDRLQDMVMLRLRLAAGLDLGAVASEYGESTARDIFRAVKPFVASGHVIVEEDDLAPTGSDGLPSQERSCIGRDYQAADTQLDGHQDRIWKTRIKLKDPEGFLVSNEVISSIFTSLPEETPHVLKK